ncbi:MAG: hypothetical protein IKK43_01850 [Clostridia bacterium]|nr:hypothetical protein [Clostridia bacterium]
MFFKKKNIKTEDKKLIPIFPIYLDTMRIRDTIAILEDGITSMRSVTKDITNEKGDNINTKISSSLYKISFGADYIKNNSSINKHNEQYEKIHTDTSLFNKILTEFIENNRIKNIVNKKDLQNVKEGDIIICEGKMSGNEVEAIFNKLYVFSEAMSAMGNKEAKTLKKQLSGVENILTKSDKITDEGNMICQLDDGTDLLVVIENKYLLRDSGVELVRGKYKILGIVYEKIPEGKIASLTRDTMLGLLNKKDVDNLYKSFNDTLSMKLDIPEIRTSIKGPSIGIFPIGIYL